MSSHVSARARRSIPAWLGLLAWTLGPAAAAGQRPLAVAVSLPPQVWLVEQLGGEHVDAWSLLQAGDGPETYQPTDHEVTRAARADLLVLIGVPFERGAWARALRRTGGLEIVEPPARASHAHEHAASDEEPRHSEHAKEKAVEEHQQHDAEPGHGHVHDPHIWLSPRRLRPHAEAITKALIALRPEAHQHFEERLQRTLERLEELHREIESVLAPAGDRPFLVHHPSWTTFAEDFGVQQLAIESRGHEPSDAELTELLRVARSAGVEVLFIQPGFAGASRHAVATALGARTETLDPLPADLPSGLLDAARQIAAAGSAP